MKNVLYNEWLSNVNQEEKSQLEKFTDKEIEEAFGSYLAFGTAGIRAKRNLGVNFFNKYVVAKYTYCYILTLFHFYGKQKVQKNGIIIFKDNRKDNDLFSKIAFSVIDKLGVKVFLSYKNEIETTPFLSYLISNNEFIGGINLTASHNPAKYSGMKFYDEIGKQIDDKMILKFNYFLSKEKFIFDIKISDSFNYLSENYHNIYVKNLLEKIGFENHINNYKNLKLTFTPHHGASLKIAKMLLEKMGVNYNIVSKQSFPDSDFINSPNPNPQSIDSFKLAILEANKNKSNFIFASDPDGDRFGVAIRKDDKNWRFFSGNEITVLELDYILKFNNKISKNDFVVKSIVTSNFAEDILKEKNVKFYNSLTGFKMIFDVINEHSKNGAKCLFAWEESNGSTINMMTKDKDTFQNLILVIEMVNHYQKENKTLINVLDELQQKYGHFIMEQNTYEFDPKMSIDKIFSSFVGKNKASNINGLKIKNVIDFRNGYLNFKKENILFIYFSDKSFIALRPSGTEPILRIYFNIHNRDSKLAKSEYILVSDYFKKEFN